MPERLIFPRLSPLSAALLSLMTTSVTAQERPPAAAVTPVERVVVTAVPMVTEEDESASPVTVLTAEALRRRARASIGDTLADELGVHSSSFGPAAGRPIIRGQDGPRVRVMQNGMGTLDASTVSADHAVTVESLTAKQVEIIRGPATLLYGSGAIGGVVNVVSEHIPRTRPVDGYDGVVESRWSTGDRANTSAAMLKIGSEAFVLHADALVRDAQDYVIPAAAQRQEGASPSGKRLAGSDLLGKTGGVGASFVTDAGFVGASVHRYSNDYGLPGPEGARITMRQTRTEAATEWQAITPWLELLKVRAVHNDYRHAELEPEGDVGTVFTNKARELRAELRLAPLAGISTALGAQVVASDFAAIGEEAVVPQTTSHERGVFAVARRQAGDVRIEAGARVDRARHTPAPADLPSRRFGLSTVSGALVWQIRPSTNISINATRSERAPQVEELYSNGPHAASFTYDVGNPALQKERAQNVDVSLRQTIGPAQLRMNLYRNNIQNYIYMASEDINRDGVADRVDEFKELVEDGEFLVQNVSQGRALFQGFEVELTAPLTGSTRVRVFADRVRAKLANGQNLPRIAPLRVGIEGVWDGIELWGGRLCADARYTRVAAATQVATFESSTQGYGKVDAELRYVLRAAGTTWLAFLQGNNLGNREVRLHTSYLKDFAPQMGRSFALGVRALF
jgi:iron complex outermembrane recepter protein